MARKFDSLVEVLHEDVLDAPSGLTPGEIGEELGFSRYNTFMNQISQQDGFKLDANMVLPLMRKTGSKRPLHYLASRMDCVVIDRPRAAAGTDTLARQAIKAVEEVGDVMRVFLETSGDGDISARDKRDVHKEIYEAVQALIAFDKALEIA
ncbi:transcriptional regulator CII, putative [Solidesulfovibrio fructosivorans JJ]]|uniref:Transcriptional regulator CII, putative n=1 Tax=Solidesulfovibrio fructosivorans JJ] TaxID=596151 RepID=E1JRD0_SOLFR|nr:phage regulatory CII family protein [Solidesulfovibrio fructosivorans]EFL53131.1 transcriptional regulator CII, putative [Solidesulfovibrio fructosivorans JJ]]